jgi:hypothetical protein
VVEVSGAVESVVVVDVGSVDGGGLPPPPLEWRRW